MLRLLLITGVVAAFMSGPAVAQSRRGFARSAEEWCNDSGNNDRASHCEVRESTIAANNPLDIDAGRNGGIHVRGADRSDAFVRARIVGYADTDAEARRIVAAVQIDTSGGRVRADGPNDDRWSVSFEVEVPRAATLALNTHNGGIAIDEFRGTAQFRAQNGGVSLRAVAGDIRGTTTNGGLTIRLDGDRWDGPGLDVETRNGGIRMELPATYSAELETGTTNGGVAIDFPVTLQGSVGRHFTTTLGAGGAKLRVITTNGGVSIHKTP